MSSLARISAPLVPLALLVTILACAAPSITPHPEHAIPIPGSVAYLSRADWGANAPVLPMRTHRIERLTIHHTGVRMAPERTTVDKLRGLQLFSQRDDSLANGRLKPAWADIPYHYYIASDGTVAEAREWRYVGDSNTPYDPTGHLLVVLEGSFNQEPLTDAQRRSLYLLVPALARHFRITAERLGGHSDHAETSCPGAAVRAEFDALRAAIRAAR